MVSKTCVGFLDHTGGRLGAESSEKEAQSFLPEPGTEAEQSPGLDDGIAAHPDRDARRMLGRSGGSRCCVEGLLPPTRSGDSLVGGLSCLPIARARAHVCVCVCVCVRERERDRETERQRKRERAALGRALTPRDPLHE